MTVKITANNAKLLKEKIEQVMNICSLLIQGGDFPTHEDIVNPNITGKHWYRKDKIFDLFPMLNDYKGFIRDETETHIDIEFKYRYDKNKQKMKSMCEMLIIFDLVELVEI